MKDNRLTISITDTMGIHSVFIILKNKAKTKPKYGTPKKESFGINIIDESQSEEPDEGLLYEELY